ncbi:MarR family winged helix-turn-helix transcriptional regulator [Streptomyces maoxianensis]|uniref:MarR family winged helix-turn-helix transcriptional regulator n=1 Tax=Streptomyces maoxianensis TaxID=1459942 RepID=A0ABV9GCS5_9ACTN
MSFDYARAPWQGHAKSRQFVQRMVNDAAARGGVETIPNPTHQRSSLIRLTDNGLAAITAVAAREQALLRQVGGDLTDADVAACARVLSGMLELCGPYRMYRGSHFAL